MAFLNGKKTYIVGIVGILGALVACWNGTMSLDAAWIAVQTALQGMTIRHAIS